MRVFFALEPQAKDKLAIDNWRQKALPAINNKIPAANFHLTLAFIGEIEEKELEPLCQMAENIQLPAFSLQFDTYGYFSKPGIFWLGNNVSPPLKALANQLQQGAGLSHKQQQNFVPHISLYRGCDTPPPKPLLEPELELKFEHFCLYRSIRSCHGIHYQCIQRWLLEPAFNL